MFVIFISHGFAQVTNLNLDLYKNYLSSHQDMTYDQITSEFPAGYFLSNINSNWKSALYINDIEQKLGLTEYEKDLLSKHGFMVSERLKDASFGLQFRKIYDLDLPVFVTTDAILYALHRSYDAILKRMEITYLIGKVTNLLQNLHDNIPALASQYSSNPAMNTYIKDVDFYLTVPLKLFKPQTTTNFSDNIALVDKFYKAVLDEQVLTTDFLSETPRTIDFSQFKPRGHYVDDFYTELADYFRVMMWLGRMELYLIEPQDFIKSSKSDIQRQAIAACLIQELIDLSNTKNDVDEIEKAVSLFVGDQDNVTLENLSHLKSIIPFNDAAFLLDTNNLNVFQQRLKEQPYADQKILSQVLFKEPYDTEDLKPASSFMLFGQRFVIDSYITGNVVFDKIKFKGTNIFRALPNLLDVLFAIGNDAAIQLLKSELEQYHYETNLASLRYLIDNYNSEFWNSSIYSSWLNSIRSLNPPENRENLPDFMKTAAWWQEKMNTQLASWTELRHDNILYAKQSYTGGTTCSFPFGYVEPIPQFYNAMKIFAETCSSKISQINFPNNFNKEDIISYFQIFYNVNDTLFSIAEKELSNTELSTAEVKFLKSLLSYDNMCGVTYSGWYLSLFFDSWDEENGLFKKDHIVADYHTAPTDAAGNMVGWVKHAGTGSVDLAVVISNSPNGDKTAFVGPVLSYYEYTTTNFLRLTDDEWKDSYLQLAQRPSFVNLYLADSNGTSRGEGVNLLTRISDYPYPVYSYEIKSTNYPNPFNPSTIISFNVPTGLSNKKVRLSIVDIQGEEVNVLVNENLQAGNYLIPWNGKTKNGLQASSGIYFYKINISDKQFVGKMNLIK